MQYHGLTIYAITSAFVCCSIAAVGRSISQFPPPLLNPCFPFFFNSPPHLGSCNNFRRRSPQHVVTQIFRSICAIHPVAVRNLVREDWNLASGLLVYDTTCRYVLPVLRLLFLTKFLGMRHCGTVPDIPNDIAVSRLRVYVSTLYNLFQYLGEATQCFPRYEYTPSAGISGPSLPLFSYFVCLQ
jgi:hypothetical protein